MKESQNMLRKGSFRTIFSEFEEKSKRQASCKSGQLAGGGRQRREKKNPVF